MASKRNLVDKINNISPKDFTLLKGDFKTLDVRKKSETKRKGYPACRPTRRVSSKTPKTLSELSPAEKRKFTKAKTSKKKISFQMRRKRKTKTKK